MPGIVILLSHERSGSHLLEEYLGTLGDVGVFDEVCNADAIKPLKNRSSFLRFKYEAIQKDASLLLEPTMEKHTAFVRAYFDELLLLKSPKNIVVDIKYGHVHNFEWWWRPMLERPFLLKFCEQENIGVLHLFRKNVVEAVASAMIADQRKVWHSWEMATKQAASQKINLPIQALVRRAKLLERQTQLFKGWIGSARKLTVTYEKLSAELGGGSGLDASLADFVGGTQLAPFLPRHQKVTQPLPQIVENYEELRQACEQAGLEKHLLKDNVSKP